MVEDTYLLFRCPGEFYVIYCIAFTGLYFMQKDIHGKTGWRPDDCLREHLTDVEKNEKDVS